MENFLIIKSVNWLELLLVLATWLVIYYQFWRPFNLTIRSNGRYKLSINPIGNRVYQTAISFGIIFTNSGARIGYVDDIVIKLKNQTETFTYVTAFNDLNEKIALPVSSNSNVQQLEYSLFTAFEIPANTSITKEIFFVPHDFTIPYLKPGEYLVFIYVRDSKNKSFLLRMQTKIVIGQEDNAKLPSLNTFEEAQRKFESPFQLVFSTVSKILPENDMLIKNLK